MAIRPLRWLGAKVRSIFRPEPTVPEPPTGVGVPPGLPPPAPGPFPGPYPTDNTRNTIGYPPYMGPEEANQLRIALSSLSTFTAFQFFNDPTAMRGYHNAYFGFKGDEDGNDWISRPGMRAERLAFLADIRRKYGIEFELDMPIDWDLLRAISGAESPF